MKKVFEVQVRYEDDLEETLMIDAPDAEDAATQAESWVDLKKEVKDITVVRQVVVRRCYV